ncbi:RagB/SusD family nutrient uptake outer membrane protein [Flammeovirga sp. SJP92]|uniref:RagB/SusD family nutrient uptake outer membrane protein n=1 Tax=Flammeovirga sp. SJP92 TaxID=1775430 RepID=UPI000789A764|nr:RagB/SusD family nutrient uptake outer membrane protein [Flammeovirga sp. SJP92]KXX67734.1 hypothetical protein AVL50_25030 [Flammeovirga sp. SJP92]
MKFNKFLGLLAAVGILSSCTDNLDVAPTGDVSEGVLLSSVQGAEVALNGIYRNMYSYSERTDHFGEMAIKQALELKADDFYHLNRGYGWFTDAYTWTDYDATLDRTEYIWSYYYENIANVNAILAKVDELAGSDDEKAVVKGQALGLRAYYYLNLVQLYQQTYVGNEAAPGVPIYIEPSSPDTPPAARSTVQEVYDQVDADLVAAEAEFDKVPAHSQEHSSHVDAKVVYGIKARAALIKNQWATAAEYAGKARAGINLATGTAFNNGFSNASRAEGWLWGLQVIGDQSTIYASWFSFVDNTVFGYAGLGMQKCINKQLFDRLGDTDSRKSLITDGDADIPYMFNKYRMTSPSTWAGDYVLMRAEEMLLIEAEAKAMLGQNAEAAQVLQELVAVRDASHNVTSLTGAALLDEISFQRRVELWGEGYRLFDLLRKKERLDRTNGGHNSGFAQVMEREVGADGWVFEIPQAELDANPNL